MAENIARARECVESAEAYRRFASQAKCDEAHDDCMGAAHQFERWAYRAAPNWLREHQFMMWDVFRERPLTSSEARRWAREDVRVLNGY